MDLDRQRQEYVEDGVTILRGAIPPDLLVRLRAAAGEVRAITRAHGGPGVTRPPGGFVGGRLVDDFADAIDTASFKEFGEVPALRQFIDAALGPDFANDPSGFTMLFEAEDREIAQGWHRDYRDNVPWLDTQRWWSVIDDVRYFCQFNAALYHDLSLWIVPGSHCRDDTPGERAVVAKQSTSPPAAPTPGDPADAARYSQESDAYFRAMPGAVQVVLSPGDIAVYRDSALHLGHYVPTIRRATLHGHLENDVTRQFFVDHFHDRPRPY